MRALNAIAERRGQTLAQMALAWVLRERPRDLRADRRQPAGTGRGLRRRAENRDFTDAELAEIDEYAVEGV